MASTPERIGGAVGVAVTQIRLLNRQHGFRHIAGTLADGRAFFAKLAPEAGAAAGAYGKGPRGPGAYGAGAEAVPAPHAAAFAAEANGLRWLAAADGGPPVPQVIAVSREFLVIELVERAGADPSPAAAARRFGADLARMHAAGAPVLRCPLARVHRVAPAGQHAAAGDTARATRLGELVRGAPPRCRTSGGRATTAPAPGRRGQPGGGGHRPDRRAGGTAGAAEPHPRRPVVGQRAVVGRPRLADRPGRARRPPGDRPGDARPVRRPRAGRDPARATPRRSRWPKAGGPASPLHQLHPLLVHVCLFGGGYTAQLTAAARAALAGGRLTPRLS